MCPARIIQGITRTRIIHGTWRSSSRCVASVNWSIRYTTDCVVLFGHPCFIDYIHSFYATVEVTGQGSKFVEPVNRVRLSGRRCLNCELIKKDPTCRGEQTSAFPSRVKKRDWIESVVKPLFRCSQNPLFKHRLRMPSSIARGERSHLVT